MATPWLEQPTLLGRKKKSLGVSDGHLVWRVGRMQWEFHKETVYCKPAFTRDSMQLELHATFLKVICRTIDSRVTKVSKKVT